MVTHPQQTPVTPKKSPVPPKSESPLKATALSKVIPDAMAMELKLLWNPEGPISRSEAFRRIASQVVNGMTEADTKRLLAEELAFVADRELKAAERNRRKTK
jgi:hypothetical protein